MRHEVSEERSLEQAVWSQLFRGDLFLKTIHTEGASRAEFFHVLSETMLVAGVDVSENLPTALPQTLDVGTGRLRCSPIGPGGNALFGVQMRMIQMLFEDRPGVEHRRTIFPAAACRAGKSEVNFRAYHRVDTYRACTYTCSWILLIVRCASSSTTTRFCCKASA